MLKSKNGKELPMIALGTYPLKGNDAAYVVETALKIGYRIIDTSDDYQNEDEIGNGWRNAERKGYIKRDEIFLQTKISDNNTYKDDPLVGKFFCSNSEFMRRHTVDEIVKEKISTSLRKMQTDYLDSVLIHLPYVDYYEEIWNTLVNLKKEGIIRQIGVSNFLERHIDNLKKYDNSPEINQLYISPFGTKDKIREYCYSHDIQLMTYSPLTDLRNADLDFSVLGNIASKYNTSIPQIIIRWNIEMKSIPIVKSSKELRLKQNFESLFLSLDKDDMSRIMRLNKNYQYMALSKMAPGL